MWSQRRHWAGKKTNSHKGPQTCYERQKCLARLCDFFVFTLDKELHSPAPLKNKQTNKGTKLLSESIQTFQMFRCRNRPRERPSFHPGEGACEDAASGLATRTQRQPTRKRPRWTRPTSRHPGRPLYPTSHLFAHMCWSQTW